jgi:hypothetical protein
VAAHDVAAQTLERFSSYRVEAGVSLPRLEDVVARSWIETGTPYQSEQTETDQPTTHEASPIE